MAVYLLDHPPTRDQYRSPRRARPTGLTVVHTAESVMDTVGPDTGAENVAAFIQRRTTAGSYHDLADSDSVIQLVRYGDEAYQDGTGSNPYALSISFALAAADWPRLSRERRAAFLAQGARAFAGQQVWLAANGYPTTPLRRVTRAQSEAGAAGFISHAERDPARRTDPGPGFPWDEFFTACRAGATTVAGSRIPDLTPAEDDMTPEQQQTLDNVAWIVGQIKGETDRLDDIHAQVDRTAWGVLDGGHGLRQMVAALTAQVGALQGAVAAIASSGSVDAAAVTAAAERGAAAALANLTLVTKGA